MTQVHFAHVMAHAFLPAGPCCGPSEATNRRLQAETWAGPHVTCAKKSQNNGFLRFIFAAKNSNNKRKEKKHARKERKLKMINTYLGVSLHTKIPSTLDNCLFIYYAARLKYTPAGTQAPSDTTAAVYTAGTNLDESAAAYCISTYASGDVSRAPL